MVLSPAEREAILQEMFDRFHITDFRLRGEVREFVALDQESQVIWLFLALKTQQPTDTVGRILNVAFTLGVAIVWAIISWVAGHPISPKNVFGPGGGEGP